MKPCPGCGESLSLSTIVWLHASKRRHPTSCDRCGLLIRNTWPGFLCGFVPGMASMLALMFYGLPENWNPIAKTVASMPVMAFWIGIFAQPTPYLYEKYCHICGKPDARFISDWHSVCVDCRGAVDNG